MTNDNKFGLQDYLSFGYLYLLLLGIARESIFYGILGVNIMSYSNLMDVLLGPIAYLNKHPTIFVIFVVLGYWMMIQPKFHQKNRHKKWYGKLFNVEKRDEIYTNLSKNHSHPSFIPKEILMIALMVASMLLGTGVGAGSKAASKMEANELEMKNVLRFVDGTVHEVRIIGQNSNYIFYVKKGDTSVSISPVAGVVKVIEQKENLE